MTACEIWRRTHPHARRSSRLGGLGAHLPLLTRLLLGLGATGLTAQLGEPWPALLLGLGGAGFALLAGPWTSFWRPDLPHLMRLPMDGATMFRLALIHGAARARPWALLSLLALAPLLDDPHTVTRAGLLIATVVAAASLGGP